MKAISIRQPYAWLVVHGIKRVENRSWTTTHRGPLLIHAAGKMHEHPLTEIAELFHVKLPSVFDLGGIVGRVELTDIVTSSDLIGFDGPFGFIFENPRPIRFRRVRGSQGIFDVP